MRLYPAIRAKMGDWNYYIVRMKMREIAQDIKLAQDIYADRTLSDAVQRELGESRVRKQIVGYLARRPDRFFSSIVVAAMEGEPSWHPVEIDESVVPSIFSQSRSLSDSFGVLSFGDEPKYYALDGQHRVAAIRLLVNDEVEVDAPIGFENDLPSVIVVLREDHDVPHGEWMRRYRRLFSSLNRWAKKTDDDTNIIMDEDDLFAILTRRLISDYEFFQAPGRERESFKVLTKGKNLRSGVSHFTTLQTLYAITRTLLSTREREQLGWFGSGGLDPQVRPSEEDIDDCYDELTVYWDTILTVLPDLRRDPQLMRGENGTGNHLLFRPIGQELLAKVVRKKLDDALATVGLSDSQAMLGCLAPLALVPWNLAKPPWRHLLSIPSAKKKDEWIIRSDERKPALEVSYRLLCWMLEMDPLDEGGIEELKDEWRRRLYPPPDEDVAEQAWQTVVDARTRIVTGDA